MTKTTVQKKSNTSSAPKILLQDRELRNGHKGAIVWLTGLSAAGKSTIAQALEQKLFDNNTQTYILDGDKIRKGLCSDLGFSPEDRAENIRRIGEVAKLFQETGAIIIVAFISPYRADRDHVRKIVSAGRFIEVFVDCPLKKCEARDPKGLYAKARKGEIPEFTGISAPYEQPLHPEIHVKTDTQNLEQCVEIILAYLKDQKILTGQW